MMILIVTNPNQPSEASEVPLSLPPSNKVWGKVMFLHLSVILFTGRGCVSSLGRHPAPSDTMGYGQQAGRRAVRILLECILVASKFTSALQSLPLSLKEKSQASKLAGKSQ